MMYCWIPREDGYALMDESGAVVGHLINIDDKTYVKHLKSLKRPSNWFERYVHKKHKNSMTA